MVRGFIKYSACLAAFLFLTATAALADSTLSFVNGATVTGSFVYDATTNTVVSFNFTSTADGGTVFSSPSGSGISLSNQDGDQVFGFDEGQTYGAIGELDIVISCNGVVNCAENATAGNSFAVTAGVPSCPNPGTATGFCIASGQQYSVPECLGSQCELLLGSGNFITITDPPSPTDQLFTFTLSTTSTGTVYNGNGGGGNNNVPEPGTLVLSALGLAAFALKRACS